MMDRIVADRDGGGERHPSSGGRVVGNATWLMLVAVMLTVTACGAGSGRPQADAPARLVTQGGPLTRQYEAADLLADRDDPETVYLSAVGLQSGECVFHVSDDGGRTWTEGPSPQKDPYTNCSLGPVGPQNVRTDLEQGPDGTLYYAFHSHDPAANGARSVLLGRSTDQGRTWEMSEIHRAPAAEPPAPPTEPPASPPPGGQQEEQERRIELNWEPHIAVDPDNPDRIVAMWRRSYTDDRPTRPYMAISEDGGQSFGEAFQMLDEDIGFDGPRPVVVGDRLIAFYRVRPGDDAPEDAPTRLMAGVSTDGGQSWEQHEIIAAPDASEPIPAYDRSSGTFHVVWHDNRNGDLDVFYAQSDDAQDWSEPQRLNDDEVDNRVGQYYPQLTVAADGTIDVLWYDYRDDPYGPPSPEEQGQPLTLGSNLGKFHSVYHTTSTDGGGSWSANLRLNDVIVSRSVGTWNGEFFIVVPPAIAKSGDRVVAAWSDTRQGDQLSGTQDIATTTLVPADSGSDTTGLVMAGVVGLVLGLGLATFGAARAFRRRGAGTGG